MRDLQVMRRLRWSQPGGYTELEVLLSHPLITHLAKGSRELDRRVKALRLALTRTVARIQRRERKGEVLPHGRSLSFAATALFRLDIEFEDLSAEKIRRRISDKWPARCGDDTVSADGFRLHLELPQVIEPVAAEFRAYAREQAARNGFEIGRANDGQVAAPDLGQAEAELGEIAAQIRETENRSHQRRIASIQEGSLRIRNEEEMLELLLLLTKSARHELRAVDHIAIWEWFDNPTLNEYLRLQLGRCAAEEIRLERIRLVAEEELESPRHRDQLAEFIKLHDDAAAELFLCPIALAEEMRTQFRPRMGLLFADPETEPVAITGWVGEGLIERAMAYTRETESLRELRDDYTRLGTGVKGKGYDTELRDRLAKLRG